MVEHSFGEALAPFWPLVATGFFLATGMKIPLPPTLQSHHISICLTAIHFHHRFVTFKGFVEETSPSRPLLFAAQVVKESGEPLVNNLLASVGLEKISQFKVRI